MAKPICLIKIDFQSLMEVNSRMIDRKEIQDGMANHLGNEYYVIVLPQYDKPHEPIDISVFYEKDFTEIQYNELKEIIEKHIHDTVPEKLT